MTGEEFKKRRKELDLTQRQMATQVGLHWNTVARMERDEVVITKPVANLVKMLSGLHKSSQSKRKKKQRAHSGETPITCIDCASGVLGFPKTVFLEEERERGTLVGFSCPVCGSNVGE